MISFYEWCIEKYYGVDNPKGDLAGDMKNDGGFPKESISKIEIEVYLMSKRACSEAIKTFRRLYEREYIREIIHKRS
jgi:uncharacterized protein YozE (UPF0346 family)